LLQPALFSSRHGYENCQPWLRARERSRIPVSLGASTPEHCLAI
jgi:hypothetical protein